VTVTAKGPSTSTLETGGRVPSSPGPPGSEVGGGGVVVVRPGLTHGGRVQPTTTVTAARAANDAATGRPILKGRRVRESIVPPKGSRARLMGGMRAAPAPTGTFTVSRGLTAVNAGASGGRRVADDDVDSARPVAR
jgi:hypothetical protein